MERTIGPKKRKPAMTSQILTPKQTIPYFHNRGCGMCYLQRNRKEPLTAIPADS